MDQNKLLGQFLMFFDLGNQELSFGF